MSCVIQYRIRFLFQSFARMIKFSNSFLRECLNRVVALKGNQRSLLRRGTSIKNVTSYCVSGCKWPNCHLVSKSDWLIMRFRLPDDAAISTSSLTTANKFCVCVRSEGDLCRWQQFLVTLRLVANANWLILKYCSCVHRMSRWQNKN